MAVLLALLAVLGQAALPQLHQWLTGSHRTDDVRSAGTTAAAITADAGTHGCATCGALAQSRVYLASDVRTTAPLALSTTTREATARRTIASRPVAHAPRSPPLAA